MSEQDKHWLVRAKTIRNLWIVGVVIVVLSVAAGFFVPFKGHFNLDGLFGFFAVYGFAACVVMVLAAKALGALLKRPDEYYDD